MLIDSGNDTKIAIDDTQFGDASNWLVWQKLFYTCTSTSSCSGVRVYVCLCTNFVWRVNCRWNVMEFAKTFDRLNYSLEKSSQFLLNGYNVNVSKLFRECFVRRYKFESLLKITIFQSPTQCAVFHEVFNDITFRHFTENSISAFKSKVQIDFTKLIVYRIVEAIICGNSQRTHSIESIL